jgi:hypothetical protein
MKPLSYFLKQRDDLIFFFAIQMRKHHFVRFVQNALQRRLKLLSLSRRVYKQRSSVIRVWLALDVSLGFQMLERSSGCRLIEIQLLGQLVLIYPWCPKNCFQEAILAAASDPIGSEMLIKLLLILPVNIRNQLADRFIFQLVTSFH